MIDIKLPSTLAGWFVWIGIILVLLTLTFTSGGVLGMALLMIFIGLYIVYNILFRFHSTLKHGWGGRS